MTRSGTAAAAALLLTCGAAPGARAALPDAPAPAAPFPTVLRASVEREPIAPGVTWAVYRFVTEAGPLVVRVVDVDPHAPNVRLDSVLAHDTVASNDERVSAMANRTHAVAGINGDYFDISASGAPVGILVRGGVLLRSPSTRPALTITRAGDVRFERYAFGGTVTTPAGTLPLTALNAWPEPSGIALLTPAFGSPPLPAGVTMVTLGPVDANPADGYRVQQPGTAGGGLRLAAGPAAAAGLPAPGAPVTFAYDTTPSLAEVAAAVGGGPLLLTDGVAVDDPASPNYAQRARRIPAAAAARLADGTLALVVVDGGRAQTSIGVNRAELIALLRALGARDAMLFDSGGSATLVGRVLGDTGVSVLNEPSDGVERPVADGLFVYSDAPLGPPARLVVRPAPIVALAGAQIPLRAQIVDAADHALGAARGPWHNDAAPDVATIDAQDVLHVGTAGGPHRVRLMRAGVATELNLEIVERVARIVIGPARVNPDPHSVIRLDAQAFDARDRPVDTSGVMRWSASGARIDERGMLAVDATDATVTARAGDAAVTVPIPVGRHEVPIDPFGDAPHGWTFVTVPANGAGSATVAAGRLALAYDFSRGVRAAYAVGDAPLGAPLALACAFDGDAGGEAVRAIVTDRYGDRDTLTFTRALDDATTVRMRATVPHALAPPLVLHALYVLGSLASPPLTGAGTLGVHDCTATLAGAQVP